MASDILACRRVGSGDIEIVALLAALPHRNVVFICFTAVLDDVLDQAFGTVP